MTHEERLTQHVTNLQWEDMPSDARDAVSTLLIDTAGVILAGLKSRECQNLLARHVAWGGAPESSVAGSEQRLPAPAAAFLGGVLAHWWEWDDTHDDSAVHASAVIFPTLLAVAEATGKDRGKEAGREFAAAAAAAFDVACQIGAALVPHYHGGVMATGVPGHIAAAAGAARLLGLAAGFRLSPAKIGAALVPQRGFLLGGGGGAAGHQVWRAFLFRPGFGRDGRAGVGLQDISPPPTF